MPMIYPHRRATKKAQYVEKAKATTLDIKPRRARNKENHWIGTVVCPVPVSLCARIPCLGDPPVIFALELTHLMRIIRA